MKFAILIIQSLVLYLASILMWDTDSVHNALFNEKLYIPYIICIIFLVTINIKESTDNESKKRTIALKNIVGIFFVAFIIIWILWNPLDIGANLKYRNSDIEKYIVLGIINFIFGFLYRQTIQNTNSSPNDKNGKHLE